MPALNRIQIVGNLEADPEVRETGDGRKVTVFRVAVSRAFTDAEGQRRVDTQGFSVEAWGRLGEMCARLGKGRLVYLEGRVIVDAWDDPEGHHHERVVVIARDVEVLDGPVEPEPAEKTE